MSSHRDSHEKIPSSPQRTSDILLNPALAHAPVDKDEDIVLPGEVDRPEPATAASILMDAMLARQGDEELQHKAVASFQRMAEADANRLLLGRSGCIQTVITAMRGFSGNSVLVRRGCSFLANIAYRSEENQKRVVDCRGVELLATLMRLREDDAEFHRGACHVLRNVTEGPVYIQKHAVHSGVLESVQRTLKSFEANADLQVHGIAAIGNIARSGLETQQRIRECGCIDAVIDAMRTHSSNFALQEKCVNTLRNVCHQNETNQRLVGEQGGIELLTVLLRENQDNPRFLVEVCSTLRYMSFVEENRSLMGKNGALVLIVESLQPVSNHCGGREAEKVLKALSNATFSPQENKQVLVRGGGLQVIMHVLTKLQNDADVLSCGLRVLRNVIDQCGVNGQQLAEMGAYSFAVERAERFKSHEGVSENLFAILVDATELEYDEGKLGISLNALQDMISQRLENLSESAPVQHLGRGLLAHLQRLEICMKAAAERGNRKKSLLRRIRRTIS